MNQCKADLMQAGCKFECNARRTHAFYHRVVGLDGANLRIFFVPIQLFFFLGVSKVFEFLTSIFRGFSSFSVF